MTTTADTGPKDLTTVADTAKPDGITTRELLWSLGTVVIGIGLGVWLVNLFALGWTTIEVVATVTGAVSVWLLARNRPLGWWIGLISVAGFLWVFYTVALYGEVGIQAFYLVTSLQAIWMWQKGGKSHEGRAVTHVPWRIVGITAVLFSIGWAGSWWLLDSVGGAAPGWDSLTTTMSVTAHLWLVWRYAQSWWLWVMVDIIYIPLYLSRGLTLTSGLYVVFLILATMGLIRFFKEAQQNKAAGLMRTAVEI